MYDYSHVHHRRTHTHSPSFPDTKAILAAVGDQLAAATAEESGLGLLYRSRIAAAAHAVCSGKLEPRRPRLLRRYGKSELVRRYFLIFVCVYECVCVCVSVRVCRCALADDMRKQESR